MPQDKLPIKDFAAKIKAKYPQYASVADDVLVQKIVAKYPEYEAQVDLAPLKKKEPQPQPSPKPGAPLNAGGPAISPSTSTSTSPLPLFGSPKKTPQDKIGQQVQKSEAERNATKPLGELEGAIQTHAQANNLWANAKAPKAASEMAVGGMFTADEYSDEELQSLQADEAAAKANKQAALKRYAPVLDKIADDFVKSGSWRSMLVMTKDKKGMETETPVVNTGALLSEAQRLSEQYGGGRAVREHIYQTLRSRVEYEQVKPKVESEFQARFKKRTGKTVEQYFDGKNAEALQTAKGIEETVKATFDAEVASATASLKQKSADTLAKYQELAKGAKTEADIQVLQAGYASELRELQTKENRRLARVREELLKSAQTKINDLSKTTGLSEADKQLFNQIYGEAYETVLKGREAGKLAAQDVEAKLFGQGHVFGKSLWSGLNKWMAAKGSALVSLGINNETSDWLRGRQTVADEAQTIDKELSGANLLDPTTYTTRLGTQFGMQAPSLALTVLTRSPMLGGTAGMVDEATSAMGDVYDRARQEGFDHEEAAQKARQLFVEYSALLPLHVGESMFMIKGLKGAKAFGMATVGQVPLEIAQEEPQSFFEQAKSKYGKGVGQFVREDALDVALETSIMAIGQSAALSSAGQMMSSLATSSKGTEDQFYGDIVGKYGENAAYAVAEQQYLNGVLDEKGLIAAKENIAKVASLSGQLQQLGLDPNKRQAYVGLQGEIKHLQRQIETLTNSGTMDPSLLKVLQAQIQDREKQGKALMDGSMGVVVVTMPTGRTFAYTPQQAEKLLQQPALLDGMANGDIKIAYNGETEGVQAKIEKAIAAVTPKESVLQPAVILPKDNKTVEARTVAPKKEEKPTTTVIRPTQNKPAPVTTIAPKQVKAEPKGDTRPSVILPSANKGAQVVAVKRGEVQAETKADSGAWMTKKSDMVSEKARSLSRSNDTSKPTENTYKEGDLAIDGLTPQEDGYVYRLEMVDPNEVEYSEKEHSEEVVREWDTTKKYTEWFKEGKQPEPITIVYNKGQKKMLSTNRRRVVAARAAGVKSIPAWVEIGKHSDIVKQAVKNGDYQRAIAEGKMTREDAVEIIESAGLEVPAELRDVSPQSPSPTPTLVESERGALEKGETQVPSKGVMKRARDIEDLTDPQDLVMQYFVGGGTINSGAIQEIFGGAGKSIQGEQRAKIGLVNKKGPSVDALAHQLWEADPTGQHTTEDYKDAIEQVLNNFSHKAEMAKDLVRRFVVNSVQENLTDKEASQVAAKQIEKIHEALEGLDEDTKAELVGVLRKYQDQYGFIDWQRLEEDTNGFDPDLLELSDNTLNKLNEVINKNLQSGQGQPSDIGSQNSGREESQGQKEVSDISPQSNELKTPSTPSQDTGTTPAPTEGSNEATGTPGGPAQPAQSKGGKYEQKARKLADKIKKADLPQWMSIQDPSVKKQGLSADDLKAALAEAVIKVGQLLDMGVDAKVAVNRGVDDIVRLYKEELAKVKGKLKPEAEAAIRRGAEDEIRKDLGLPPAGSVVLSHKGLQEVADEFGLADVQRRERKSDAELQQEAEETMQDWKDRGVYAREIENLVSLAESARVLTDTERVILEQHLANLIGEARGLRQSDPSAYDEALVEIRRVKRAGEITRSAAGAALRIPSNAGSVPRTIEDAMVDRMEAAGVDVLTEAQKADVEAKFAAMQAALAEEKRLREAAEAANARLQAEAEILAARKTRPAPQPKAAKQKDYKKEREGIKAAIKEKLRKSRGQMNSAGQAMIDFVSIAPDVARLMKSYVEEGVVTLQEIIQKIHTDVKEVVPEVTEDDIRDVIAGRYNEPRPTKSDLLRQMQDLRTEAKLLAKLADLESGEIPQNPRRQVVRNQRIKELRDQIEALQKASGLGRYSPSAKERAAIDAAKESIQEMERKLRENDLSIQQHKGSETPALRALRDKQKDLRKQIDAKRKEAGLGKWAGDYQLRKIKERNEAKLREVQAKLRAGDFSTKPRPKSAIENPELKAKYPELYQQTLDAIAAKEKAQHELNLANAREAMALRPGIEKFMGKFGKTLRTLKATMAGIDMSALGVQNLPAILSNPYVGFKAFKGSLTDMGSAAHFERELARIHASEWWPLIEQSGLSIIDPKSLRQAEHNDLFNNTFYDDLNITRNGQKVNIAPTKPFERQFTSLGNYIRINLFLRRVEKLLEQGKTFENSPESFKTVASIVNNMTGRGSGGEWFEKNRQALSTIFWSPGLMSSSFNLLGISDVALLFVGKKGFYGKILTSDQKLWAAGQIGRAISTGIVIMLAIAWSDDEAEIDWDPTSVTFGYVKSGDYSWSIFGRFTKPVRYIVMRLTGVKTTPKGEVELDDNPYGATMGEELYRGVSGYFNPVFGTGVNIAKGTDFSGQPTNVANELGKMLYPMSFGEFYKGYQADGVGGVLKKGVPSFAGIRVIHRKDFYHPLEAPKKLRHNGVDVDLPEGLQKQFTRELQASEAAKLPVLQSTNAYKQATPQQRLEMESWLRKTVKSEEQKRLKESHPDLFPELSEEEELEREALKEQQADLRYLLFGEEEE